ncbi:MAG: hypothetical protein U0V56_13420 [Actinomycetota bacterium]
MSARRGGAGGRPVEPGGGAVATLDETTRPGAVAEAAVEDGPPNGLPHVRQATAEAELCAPHRGQV